MTEKIICPDCGKEMVFVPKDERFPWIMLDGMVCDNCGSFYFLPPSTTKNENATCEDN